MQTYAPAAPNTHRFLTVFSATTTPAALGLTSTPASLHSPTTKISSPSPNKPPASCSRQPPEPTPSPPAHPPQQPPRPYPHQPPTDLSLASRPVSPTTAQSAESRGQQPTTTSFTKRPPLARNPPPPPPPPNEKMCDFELIVYRCKHTKHRRFAYCHHARSQPGHICSGVKALKRVWPAEEDCEGCTQAREAMQAQGGRGQPGGFGR